MVEMKLPMMNRCQHFNFLSDSGLTQLDVGVKSDWFS